MLGGASRQLWRRTRQRQSHTAIHPGLHLALPPPGLGMGSTLPGTPRRVGGTVHPIRIEVGSPHLRAAASKSQRDGRFRHLGSTLYLL